MVEKMMLEYEKLYMQRTLLMSGMLSLMSKSFEDEEVNTFKRLLAEQFMDKMSADNGKMLLEDMTEEIVFKSMYTFMIKEKALLDVKTILNKI